MANINTARSIAGTLGVDLSRPKMAVLHRLLTEYARTPAGGASQIFAEWGSVLGTLSDQQDLSAEFDKALVTRYFLGE